MLKLLNYSIDKQNCRRYSYVVKIIEQGRRILVNNLYFDYSKLAGRIVEKFGSQLQFASAINMSERSLSLKLNNKVSWKQPEIIKACTELRIDDKDIPTYFFSH